MPVNFTNLLTERVQLGKEVRTPGGNDNASFAILDKSQVTSKTYVTPGTTNYESMNNLDYEGIQVISIKGTARCGNSCFFSWVVEGNVAMKLFRITIRN